MWSFVTLRNYITVKCMLTSRRQSQKNRATSFSGRDDDDDDDDDDSAVVGSLSIKISRGDVFDDKNLPQ